jgi:outer membrane biosynthesis protein TonB
MNMSMMKITIEIETPVSERVLTNLAAALGGKSVEVIAEAPAEVETTKAPETPKATKAKKSEVTKDKKPEAEPTPAVDPEPASAEDAQPESEAEPEVTYTLEQVRNKLAELSRAGKQAQVKALIEKHGASKLSEIKGESYAALMKDAEGL